MKDKLPFCEKEFITLPEYTGEPYIAQVDKQILPYGNYGTLPIDVIDKILSIMESYLTQFGLVQLCIETDMIGDDEVVLQINWEGQKMLLPSTGTSFGLVRIAQFTKRIPGSGIYDYDADYMSKACSTGRDIYFALRKKHPLLTRDLSSFGYCGSSKRIELVCDKCGMVRIKRRKCQVTEHPERYRCTCGGEIRLVAAEE